MPRTRSAEGKGLLTIGIVGISMAPLKTVSDRAAELESKLPTGESLPGLAEQYVEQAKRLAESAPNAEFVTIPGFYSFPSTSLSRGPTCAQSCSNLVYV